VARSLDRGEQAANVESPRATPAGDGGSQQPRSSELRPQANPAARQRDSPPRRGTRLRLPHYSTIAWRTICRNSAPVYRARPGAPCVMRTVIISSWDRPRTRAGGAAPAYSPTEPDTPAMPASCARRSRARSRSRCPRRALHDLHGAEVVGGHEGHRGGTQQSRALELAAVEEHPQEACVVASWSTRCRRRPRRSGRHRHVVQLDRLSRARLDGQRLGNASYLGARHHEARVRHLQRPRTRARRGSGRASSPRPSRPPAPARRSTRRTPTSCPLVGDGTRPAAPPVSGDVRHVTPFCRTARSPRVRRVAVDDPEVWRKRSWIVISRSAGTVT